MTEVQKYQKKKNALIISFMFLLVIFVGLMCFIVLRAKLKPLAQPIDPNSIEIKQIAVADYPVTTPSYSIIRNSSYIAVVVEGEEYEISLGEDKKVKLLKNDLEEDIQIMSNDNDINENIKLLYRQNNTNVILTESGELYKLNDNTIENNQLFVEQVLIESGINDIIYLSQNTDSIYVLDGQDRLINIDNQKEYNGVVKEIDTSTSTVYIYENGYFGLEEGKVFVDDNYKPIEINLSFDNKIIGMNNIVYEINSSENNLYTSKLGEYQVVGYNTSEEDNIYNITVRTNTGSYDLKSNYYYVK